MPGPTETAANTAFVAQIATQTASLTTKIAELEAKSLKMQAENQAILTEMKNRMENESYPRYGEFDQKYLYELMKKVFDTNSQNIQIFSECIKCYTELLTFLQNDATLSANSLAGGYY